MSEEGNRKQYGKLTTDQFRAFVALVPELRKAYQDVQAHMSGLPAKRVDEILSPGYNWATVYECSLVEHLSLTAVALNLGSFVHDAATSSDPQQYLLDHGDSDLVEEINPKFEVKDVVGLVMSLGKTIGSLMSHGRSLSSFVADVREKGDLDALFEVVRMDRAAVVCPSIADRIARAELLGDEAFFVRLQNALKGPSKKRWGGPYDKMRYAMALLRELGINDLGEARLRKLFVDDLGAYDDRPSAGKNLQAQYQKSRRIKTI